MFRKDIGRERKKTYLGTIKPMRPDDDVFLLGAKELVKGINQGLRDGGAGYRFRISMTPGKVNPAYAWKYQNKHSPRKVRIEDAATVDVYIHKRKA